jgi:hypothetical protein
MQYHRAPHLGGAAHPPSGETALALTHSLVATRAVSMTVASGVAIRSRQVVPALLSVALGAVRLAVNDSFVEKLTRRRRESGTLALRVHGGRAPLLNAFTQQMRVQLQAQPDTILEEWRARLGRSVSLSTRWDPAHVACVDETSLNTAMARLSG